MLLCLFSSIFFFFNDTATTEIYTLSLHDALPILFDNLFSFFFYNLLAIFVHIFIYFLGIFPSEIFVIRSEEHTCELQSPCNLVCRLLLEKKKKKNLALILICSML